jgi:hypothetical protein
VIPKRLRLSRAKGATLPDGAVNVSRPTKWGNPYKVGEPQTPDRFAAVSAFYSALHARRCGVAAAQLGPMRDYPSDDEIRAELAGHDLACWCPASEPCHADVLLEIANTPPKGT